MATSGRHEVGGGPDWQDVLECIEKVNQHHQVHTTITVMPDASRRGHLHVVVSASPDSPNASIADAFTTRLWGVDASLPTGGLSSFASRVWSLLIELDVLLASERWAPLPLDLGEA